MSVVVAPMSTALSLLFDAAGQPQGVPSAWRCAVRDGLSGNAPTVLASLVGPGVLDFPHCLGPAVAGPVADFDDHLEQVVSTASEQLPGEIEATYGGTPPTAWRAALRSPARWVSDYANTMRSVWHVLRPLWQRAQPLLQREVHRVGVASVSGGLEVVLSGLSSRWRYAQQTLAITDSRPERFALAGRRLELWPAVSGAGASMFAIDLPGRVWLGYPVPGLDTVRSGRQVAVRDGLQLVLGSVRARLLRSLDAEQTMSTLAAGLNCAPSLITYHSVPLVDAGLLYRVRRGRQVYLGRTDQGNAMLELLAR